MQVTLKPHEDEEKTTTEVAVFFKTYGENISNLYLMETAL